MYAAAFLKSRFSACERTAEAIRVLVNGRIARCGGLLGTRTAETRFQKKKTTFSIELTNKRFYIVTYCCFPSSYIFTKLCPTAVLNICYISVHYTSVQYYSSLPV